MAMDSIHDLVSPSDGDAGSTTRSAAKAFANKYRGVMMRPMTTAVSKAQADFKPFVLHPEDIDHNLYGKFLGILKDAGVPWKARRLPESREDAMHIMNAMVASINAYQHYQKDIERAYHEIESSMASNKTHSHNQAADVSKLHNEVTMLRKKLAGTENTLAKQNNDLKAQLSSTKAKLAQTERELNDSQIQGKKLEKKLQLEKKQADHLMTKIMTADKPKFGKAAKAPARSPGGNLAIEPNGEASENSLGNRIGQLKISSATPSPKPNCRSALPWLDNDEEGIDRTQRHEYLSDTSGATTAASPGASPSTVARIVARRELAPQATSPGSPLAERPKVHSTGRSGIVHKVQVTAASPTSTESGSVSGDEEVLDDDEDLPGDAPKTKSRFKKFLKAFKMSTKPKEGKESTSGSKSQSSSSKFLSRTISPNQKST